jgi:hypothetical protein
VHGTRFGDLTLSLLQSGTEEHYPCLDGFAPSGSVSMNSFNARCSALSPNKISLEKHSCLTDQTHRSTNVFQFGLCGGSATQLTPSDRSTSLKEPQNLESRSWSR